MKGLLLKEFYIWLKSRIGYMLIILAYGIVFAATGGSRSTFVLWFVLIPLSRAFTDDETSNWKNYSRALPYTPSQIVTARYIFLLAELIFASIITTVSVIISFRNSEFASVTEAFPYLSDSWMIASSMTVIITVMLLSFAFTMPLNYQLTGTARNVISIIPNIISMFAIVIISFDTLLPSFLPNHRIPRAFYNEKWLFAAFATVSVLALSASWLLCIIFTAKNKSRTKSLKISFAVVTAVLIAVSSVTIGSIFTKKLFVENEHQTQEFLMEYYQDNIPSTEDGEKENVLSEEKRKNREEMIFLKENLFSEYHDGYLISDCRKELEELGLYERANTSDEYCLRDGGAIVRLFSEEDTDRIYQISISANVGDTYLEKATTEDLDKIGNRFKAITTEDELWNLYKELELYPHYIEEKYDSYYGKMRSYNASLYASNYNKTGKTVYYQVFVDVSEGKISNVDLNTYEQN